MSSNLEKFEEFIRNNPKVGAELKDAKTEKELIDKCLLISKGNGFPLTIEQVEKRLQQLYNKNKELNVNQLDQIAGGQWNGPPDHPVY